MVCGDKKKEDYDKSIEDWPWLALPFKSKKQRVIEKLFPKENYPAMGVMNGLTGKVMHQNVYGKWHIAEGFTQWLSEATNEDI